MTSISIDINGKRFEVGATDGVATLTYASVIEMAGYTSDSRPTVVGYSRVPAWPNGTPQGFSLTAGGECYILNGARFTVVHTGNA